MVDGVHGHVDCVVRHVMAHKGALEVVTVPNLCVEAKTVLGQVMKQDHVVIAVQVIKIIT